jgi:hypothetical protein
MDRIQCPLCIDKTGRARTAPESRYAKMLPFKFAATSVEVIPCRSCQDEKAIVSVRITKSRALALAWDEPVAYHAAGLVGFG